MEPDVDDATPRAQGLVLWAGTVRRTSLPERLHAGSRLGYEALSLSPTDYRRALRSGDTDHDIRMRIADAGMYVNCLDPYTRWLPAWEPRKGAVPDMLNFIGADEREFFNAAEAVRARSMTVFEPFGRLWPTEVIAESLSKVCNRARNSGMTVNVEFIPFLGIPDLDTAWQAIQMCGDPEVGIVLDTWHYFRGNPDDDLLASIPGERIGAVQLSDALSEPVGSLENDCLHHRLPLGGGSFSLHQVHRTLRAIGGLNSVGPEIFSDAFDRRPAEVNATQALTGVAPWQSSMETQPESQRTTGDSLTT
jgi:sugar phosphate isomerase/epimerase